MITVTKRPFKYSPAGNPQIWQFSSDKANLVSFSLKVIDHSNAGVISVQMVHPTPRFPRGSYFDLGKILANYVTWDVSNDPVRFIVPIQKSLKAYTLEITERVLVGNSIVDGDSWNNATDPFFVWNSQVSRTDYHDYNHIKYVINSNGVASFLTNSPNFKTVNPISVEHLYFMHDGSTETLIARVKTFKSNGELIRQEYRNIPSLDQFKMYRLNVSPKALMSYFNFNFDNVAYYTVDIVDGLMSAKTNERVFVLNNANCSYEYINLLWFNSLGGIDSYSFMAPTEAINIERTTLKKNVYQFDADNIYSDIQGNIYNPSEVIIDSNVATSIKLYSSNLSDDEAYWLVELFASKQIFVEMINGSLIPAMLNNTNYTVARERYARGNSQMNTINIDVNLGTDIIPAAAQAYSTRRGNIDFIDSQMNGLGNGLPGWGVNPDPNGPRQYDPEDYGRNYA